MTNTKNEIKTLEDLDAMRRLVITVGESRQRYSATLLRRYGKAAAALGIDADTWEGFWWIPII